MAKAKSSTGKSGDKGGSKKNGPTKNGRKEAGSAKFNETLREAGQKAAELAQNPVARSMLAAGLVTAAALSRG